MNEEPTIHAGMLLAQLDPLRPGATGWRISHNRSSTNLWLWVTHSHSWSGYFSPFTVFQTVIFLVKKSTKAVLLSAFIFPGVGHVFLKKYTRGVALAGASFAAIYYLISETVGRALQIAAKIQSGDVQLDVEAITALASKQTAGSEAQLLNIATAAFIICWLIGIVDSFIVGRSRDKNDDVLGNR